MLCQSCKKNDATVHYTEVINNNVKKTHLCESCAKQKGVDIELPFSFGDIIKAISKGIEGIEDIEGIEHIETKHFSGEAACPECGLEIQELLKQGKIGCAQCFDVFEEILDDIIKNVQKSPNHKGKIPKFLPPTFNYKSRIKKLEGKLQAAIDKEKYEDCVSFRDEINTLKNALENESNNF